MIPTLVSRAHSQLRALSRHYHRHEDPKPLDDGVILSEAEFDSMSKRNVERWVSAHIIPVSSLLRGPAIRRGAHGARPVQTSPISLASDSQHQTLLPGKNVTFTVVGSDQNAPEWQRVALDGSVQLIGKKEVSGALQISRVGAFGALGLFEAVIYDRVLPRRLRTGSSTSLMAQSRSIKLPSGRSRFIRSFHRVTARPFTAEDVTVSCLLLFVIPTNHQPCNGAFPGTQPSSPLEISTGVATERWCRVWLASKLP